MSASKDQISSARQSRIETEILVTQPFKTRAPQKEPLAQRMASTCTPGISIAVIEHGEIEWAKGYGVRENGKPDPITRETLFQAASISKPVAALTALCLVEEGKLALDEDIRGYQTTWQVPHNSGWQPQISVRQLLSHSAGLTVHGFLGYMRHAQIPTLLQLLDGKPPANSPAVLVDTIPALQFRYSGGGFCVLQQLIEDVTGKPFSQVARERVLEPADMRHSTYEAPLPVDRWELAAAGHRSDGEPLGGKWHIYPESAAAGLWTTPEDLARLVLELQLTRQGTAGKIISARMLDQLLTPQIEIGGQEFNAGMGLGFLLQGKGDTAYFSHSGGNEGFRCQLTACVTGGRAAVLMTNSDSGSQLYEEVLNTIAQEYGWPDYLTPTPSVAVVEPETVGRYAGLYQHKDRLQLKVVSEGIGLQIQAAGQAPLSFLPRSPREFFSRAVNTQIAFTGEGDLCTGLILRQNGEELNYRKVS